MKQIWNPYLPSYEYIPDGEPHVFGDRVYVYGSHDAFGADKFCMNHYVCYSASVTNLKDWKYEGVIYRNDQDIRMKNGNHQLWAPDVVRGKDGKYYMYYCPDDSLLEIGVAVCDTPAGKYEFAGLVRDKAGKPIGSREGDTIPFDPGIFIDDDGTIYLYSGNGPRIRADIGKEQKASVVMTLEDDMVTVKTEPKKLLPILGEEDPEFSGHEFFEASSIRKINGTYYLVYSSANLHELCYATSDKPDEGFHYGGVIISNCDIFPETKRIIPRNCFGNNHGSIECINGNWYVFYHRQTNQTMFSRQGCAEKITILEDGRIPQVQMTSSGLNGEPLAGKGKYTVSMVCNLFGKETPTISHPLATRGKHPFFTQSGSDYDPENGTEPPFQYITNCQDYMTAVFRNFIFENVGKVAVTVRGTMQGIMEVLDEQTGEVLGKIEISSSDEWKTFENSVSIPDGEKAIGFRYRGEGTFEFLDFEFSEE